MMFAMTQHEPWPMPDAIEIAAVIRDGYACRRCRAVVLGDDRRVVCTSAYACPTLATALTLCERCAALHTSGR
jgi:hypothetical protein